MLDAASKIETKIEATTKPTKSMMIPGRIGELTGDSSVYFIMIKLVIVEMKAMQTLAMNINISENPSTKANLAEFFSTKMKACKADEQKFSLEIAR